MGFSSKRQCVHTVVGSEETEQRNKEIPFVVEVFKYKCCKVLLLFSS